MTTSNGRANGAGQTAERWIEGFALGAGVWATAVPFPSPLAYSYSYALRFRAGVVVVDLGWDSDEAWQAFCSGLARTGATLDDVVGVVVTHAHPDHYGLARRIKAATSAWIGLHPAERALITVDAAERQRRLAEIADWLRRCGAPAAELVRLEAEIGELEAALTNIEPDVELADGTPVPGTDGGLVALHTPGHTPGHLCFHDRDLLLTGDHVLPRITPNVAKRPGSDLDPPHDFLGSLRLLGTCPPTTLVLPGHEWTFDRLPDRVAALERHHDARLTEVVHAVRGGCGTVWEVAQVIRWARPVTSFSPRSLRSALAETSSHLFHLSQTGRLDHVDGEPDRFTVREARRRADAAIPVDCPPRARG